MIDPKADAAEKLSQARRLFEEAVDHFDTSNAERRRCGRFFHNTELSGQWEEEDLKYLQDQKRPALSFNVLRTKVETALGMHGDQQRVAVPRPVGGEDKFKADILRAVCDRVHAKANIDVATDEAMRSGYVKGEGDVQVDVAQDPDVPSQVKISVYYVSPHEVHWDPGSRKRDRSDAAYVCWDKWLTEAEFKAEYPDHADKWQEVCGSSFDGTGDGAGGEPYAESAAFDTRDGDYNNRAYYWDSNKRRARVVHIEYVTTRPRTFAMADGRSVLLDDDEAEMLRKDEYGMFGEFQLTKTLGEVVHVFEFCGVADLYDSTDGDDQPYPFDGFSLVPFTWAIDSEDGTSYGMVRNLLDPQTELNKAWSSSLEYTVGQGKMGYLYEEGSIPDKAEFEVAVATSGSAAMVAKGALTRNEIQPRPPPQVSPAIEARLNRSLEMVDRVSSISTDLERPAAMNEPATSVAIRYHKSQLGLTDVRKGFDIFLIQIEQRILQSTTRAMPDEQIQAMIGNDDKYVVQGGMVIEMGPHPENPQQKVPVREPVSLRDLRAIEYDIELDMNTRNSTLRGIKADRWLQMRSAGVAIPDTVIVEASTDSRSEREQLKEFAEQQGKLQAKNAAQEAKIMQGQVAASLKLQAQADAEDGRHNRVEEALKAQKQQQDAAVKLAAVLERADSDEKSWLLGLVQHIQAREAAQHASRGGGTQ